MAVHPRRRNRIVKRLLPLTFVVLGLLAATAAFAEKKPVAAPAAAVTTPPATAAAAAVPAVVDSLALLEREVARDSSKFDKVYALGLMYLDHEKMPEALRVLGKASQLQPKNVKVLVNMGIAADAVGHPDEAQGYYERALTLTPSDSMAACRMASSKYAQGKYDESMALLRTIIARQPRAHCAYFTLGVAFADAGIYRDAIRMWRKVVDLAPDSPEAVSAKESIDVLEKFLQQK
jgi:tetratricopeptide (TPR) repeat protein